MSPSRAAQLIHNCSNARNTLHVDDLSRNFVLNMSNGIKIPAFKDVTTSPAARSDRELERLARYLLHVASAEDVSVLNHKVWAHLRRPFLTFVNLQPQDWRKISHQLGGGS